MDKQTDLPSAVSTVVTMHTCVSRDKNAKRQAVYDRCLIASF